MLRLTLPQARRVVETEIPAIDMVADMRRYKMGAAPTRWLKSYPKGSKAHALLKTVRDTGSILLYTGAKMYYRRGYGYYIMGYSSGYADLHRYMSIIFGMDLVAETRTCSNEVVMGRGRGS